MRTRAHLFHLLLLVVALTAACSFPLGPGAARPASPTTSAPETEQATATPTSAPRSQEPTTSPSLEPSPTLLPSPTPVEPSRIVMEPDQNPAVLEAQLGDGQADRYVLSGREGQALDVTVDAPRDVGLAIWGADGISLKRRIDEKTSWRGELPTTQDTFIEVSALDATAYTLTVRIVSSVAEASIEVTEPDGSDVWLEGSSHTIVWRSSGVQTVDVEVASGGKPLGYLALGVEAAAGELTWDIPVGLITNFGVSRSDAMRVRVSSSNNPNLFDENDQPFTVESPRMRFTTGASSTTVTGSLAADGGSYRYALRATEGQTMELEVTPSELEVEIWGAQEGSMWQIPVGQRSLTVEELPATQDYFITLINPSEGEDVSYALDVGIP